MQPAVSPASGIATYLITFACYGARLPGGDTIADRQHNAPGAPFAEPNERRPIRSRSLMKSPPYLLDGQRRPIVLKAIQQVCAYRRWALLAAHVRRNHVHVVIEADRSPEQVMNTFKAYASRSLSWSQVDEGNPRRWARHGNTRYLWHAADLVAAVRYVVSEQGEAMSGFDYADRTEPRA